MDWQAAERAADSSQRKAAEEYPDDAGTECDRQASILLVDDTPENLAAFESVLGDLNQNIVKANSGREALGCLLRQDFAVILLDVNMPEMNGFETATLIRQRPKSQHTPIIFVSAVSASEAHASKGYALGAVDYIFAPVLPEVLRSKVAVFVELYRKSEEVKTQAARLSQLNRRETERRLTETRERLDIETQRNRFFDLSLELLAITDLEGRMLQVNPSWQRVLGFTPDELYRKCSLELVHPEDVSSARDYLRQLNHSDSTASSQGRYLCKDGDYRWLRWTAASVVEQRMIYVFARDITAQKLAEQQIQSLNVALTNRAAELEAANNELKREMTVRQQAETALKESNAELESFAYSVSHDLRAPLRAMQGFAQALVEDCSNALGPAGMDYAQRIASAGARLDALIQDLLLYSRITHRKLEVRRVDVRDVIREALAQLEVPLRDAGACVECDEPLFPVMGHHSTLVQVVSNLLSNAIKFVPPNKRPQVRIRMENLGSVSRLWILDNGIGVAPEFQTRIFRVFERLHGVEAYPGTGVGLAIVRKGIERMCGRVGVVSIPGEGSEFWLELPCPPETNREG